MLYSCTYMATVGVKELKLQRDFRYRDEVTHRPTRLPVLRSVSNIQLFLGIRQV